MLNTSVHSCKLDYGTNQITLHSHVNFVKLIEDG